MILPQTALASRVAENKKFSVSPRLCGGKGFVNAQLQLCNEIHTSL